MKRIILFNLLYHILLFLLPLIIVFIFEGYGTEMFAYTFYFCIMYFCIGFVLDGLIIAILNYFEIIRLKWILFILISITVFLITVYILTHKNIILELFTFGLDANYVTIIFLISILVSFSISLKLIRPDKNEK
ncbi:hypothetical protein [Chryseobacterium sp. JM1]|uniref:hypothetical protein n=1 Tax=Chryseobacterium sp. JM1 TaxID=1233950 RepID=UPI0004E78A0F|nr:hypothetical protein [Chryseobacterium sp. JM1]KFF21497.1 hypothetical protein IW22_05915 [Chryseobacterium sp. JM1]